MLPGVGQRLLHDSEDGRLHGRGQPSARQRVHERHGGDLHAGVGDQRFDRLHDAEFVERGWPQAADQPTRLFGRCLQQPDALVEFPGRLPRAQRVAAGFEMHQAPCQVLGEAVVDLVGDQLAFLLLDLQEPPEHRPFAA